MKILANHNQHNADTAERLESYARRIVALEAELAIALQDTHQRFLDWRGVETPCQLCNGSGRITYSNTATWRGGNGGSAITADVCNRCWGTGDEHRKGVNLHKALVV